MTDIDNVRVLFMLAGPLCYNSMDVPIMYAWTIIYVYVMKLLKKKDKLPLLWPARVFSCWSSFLLLDVVENIITFIL